MPGPASHYLVGKKLPQELNNQLGKEANSVIEAIHEFPQFLAFGTTGPDFLFFNTKDMPPAIHFLTNLYKDVAQFITGMKKKIRDAIPDELIELKEQLDEAIEGTVEHSSTLSELEALISDVKSTISALKDTVIEKLTEHITDSYNVFEMLEHPIQDATPQSKWWWFDTLHYRRTGDFAHELLNQTKNNPISPEHAYAIGYLTHVAADVVGHPYVNMIAGGPYRLHGQRHKLVENFQDVWLFQDSGLGELVYSGLHEQFELGDNFPSSLRSLISHTIKKVYGSDFGPEVTGDDLDTAYWYWYRWFRNSTERGTLSPPQPYSITGEIQEVWETFLENVEGAGDLIPDAYNAAGGGFLGILAAIAAAILAPILLALALIDYLLGMITTITVSAVRFLLSVCYECLYNSFMKYRYGVALNGLAFPIIGHLNKDIVQHLTDPRLPDILGNYLSTKDFPKLKFNRFGSESHLVFPQSGIERKVTTPAPKLYQVLRPNVYIHRDIHFDLNILGLIRGLNEDTLDELHVKMRSEQLGNAARLTTELYRLFFAGKKFPNFNLDADRGMGYPSWKVEGDRPIIGTSVDIKII